MKELSKESKRIIEEAKEGKLLIFKNGELINEFSENVKESLCDCFIHGHKLKEKTLNSDQHYSKHLKRFDYDYYFNHFDGTVDYYKYCYIVKF